MCCTGETIKRNASATANEWVALWACTCTDIVRLLVTCHVTSAKCIEEFKNRTKSEVHMIESWMLANKLTLNASKSNLIITISKLNSPHVDLNISCKNGIIKSVQSSNYLGVIIDNKLSLKEHIQKLEVKVSRSMGAVFSGY